MAVLQIPAIIQVQVFETSSTQAIAAFTEARALQLKYIVLALRRVGTAGGGERFRLKVYGNADLSVALATSAWLNLSAMEAMTTQWYGWARFDFSRTNIAADRRYFLAVETDAYTRNGTTFYVGAVLDNPSPFNRPAGGEYAAANFRNVGYR